MWAGGTDPRYQAALVRPHTHYSRVDIETFDGKVLETNLPITAGNVRASLQSRVTRNLSFTLPGYSWMPVTRSGDIDPGGLLAPYTNRVRVWGGVKYGDGSIARFPVFYGRLSAPSLDLATGAVTVTAVDLAQTVIDAKFESPTNSVATNSILAEWQRLILLALPGGALFGTSTAGPTTSVIGPLSWESDRGQALDDMAAAAGCIWWQLPDGHMVLRTQPWSVPGLSPVVTLGDGTTSGMRTFTGGSVSFPTTGLTNVSVLSSERLSGEPPLTSIQRDLDPNSPTYYYGGFGHKPLITQNQAPYNQAQLDYATKVQLHYGKSLIQQWDNVSIIPDASLELGDLVEAQAGGLRSEQVITGFTYPLMEGSNMPLTLRAYAPLAGV